MSKDKKDKDDNWLERARANVLNWGHNATDWNQVLTHANLTINQRYAFAVFIDCLNGLEQLSKVKYYNPKDGVKDPRDNKGQTYFIEPSNEKFNPKIHWIIDERIESKFATNIIKNLCYTSVAISGKRSKLLIKEVCSIGRQNSLFGSLGALMGGKEPELDQPEEVPVNE